MTLSIILLSALFGVTAMLAVRYYVEYRLCLAKLDDMTDRLRWTEQALWAAAERDEQHHDVDIAALWGEDE